MQGSGVEDIPVREGEIIAGKYQIARVVARGGMGLVVAARHLELGHDVALKFLLRSMFNGPDAIPRFQQEARAVVQLKSEHVVRVSDVGMLPSGDPFLVMELLQGSDLKSLVEKDGAFPLQAACDYVIQTCEAIAEAHAAGIIHRDIKPANLFLTTRSDGSPLIKVLDFGIAKVTDALRIQGSATATGSILGSPHYMSPEQITNAKNVDVRSDVWGLGVVIYELLAANMPFSGDSFGVLFNQIMNLAHTPLKEALPSVPDAIDKLVSRCLEKSPQNRPANVAEIVNVLAPYASPTLAGEVDRIRRLISKAPAAPPSVQSPTQVMPPKSVTPQPAVSSAPPTPASAPPPYTPSHMPSPHVTPQGAQAQLVVDSGWGNTKNRPSGQANSSSSNTIVGRLVAIAGVAMFVIVIAVGFGAYKKGLFGKHATTTTADSSSAAAPPATTAIATVDPSTIPSTQGTAATASDVSRDAGATAAAAPTEIAAVVDAGSSSTAAAVVPNVPQKPRPNAPPTPPPGPTGTGSAKNPIKMDLQ